MIEIKNKSRPGQPLAEMRAQMNGLGLGEVQIQEFGAPDDVLIRIGTQEGGDASQQIAIQKVKERSAIRSTTAASRWSDPRFPAN